MRRALLIAALISFAAPSGHARETRSLWTGDKLYQNCVGGDLPVCVGYLVAILDLSNRKEFGPTSTQRYGPAYPHYCFPEGEDIGSAVDAVIAYLQGHPEARRLNASHVSIRALASAFPCGYPLGRRAGTKPNAPGK